jgi:hypothetical protein
MLEQSFQKYETGYGTSTTGLDVLVSHFHQKLNLPKYEYEYGTNTDSSWVSTYQHLEYELRTMSPMQMLLVTMIMSTWLIFFVTWWYRFYIQFHILEGLA